MNKKICLFGASGHGKVIKDMALSIGVKVLAFVDDNPKVQSLHTIPVIKTIDIDNLKKEDFVISIGSNKIRKKISENLDVSYTTLIASKVIVSNSVFLEEGTVVMPSSVINTDAKVGKHCIINTGAILEHDCIIEDFVHISPNATITGSVLIGEGTHIGAGAIIIPGVSVGKWVTVGAGSVIINDIPDYATVVGNPGKIIKIKE